MDNDALAKLAIKYELWLTISAWIVFIGILGETVSDVIDTLQEKEGQKKPCRKIALIFIWSSLIMGGVLGEWYSGIQLSHTEDKEVANAEREAAEAKFKLQEFSKRRRLNDWQKKKLTKLLSFNPKELIAIYWPSEDDEARSFADDFHVLLSSIGWKKQSTRDLPNSDDFGFGISVNITSTEESQAERKLFMALQQIGVKPKRKRISNKDFPPFLLFVGHKEEVR